jgi:hypothetical protein
MLRKFINEGRFTTWFHDMRTVVLADIAYRVFYYRCGLKEALKWFLRRNQTPTSTAALEEVRLVLLLVLR